MENDTPRRVASSREAEEGAQILITTARDIQLQRSPVLGDAGDVVLPISLSEEVLPDPVGQTKATETGAKKTYAIVPTPTNSTEGQIHSRAEGGSSVTALERAYRAARSSSQQHLYAATKMMQPGTGGSSLLRLGSMQQNVVLAPALQKAVHNNKVVVRNKLVLKNPHLRKFRNFALGYIAFINNRWKTLEYGRPTAGMINKQKGIKSAADQGYLESESGGIVSADAALRAAKAAKPLWVSLPGSYFQKFWEVFMFFPILYTASITPFRVFFEETYDPVSLGFEDFIYACFVADLILRFTMGYTEIDGATVVSPKKIAMNYFKGWFVLDFVACLPIDFIMDNHGQGSANELSRLTRLPRALRLLRLLRLVKLARISKLGGKLLKSSDVHPAIIRLISSVFWAMMALHIFSGVWYMLADIVDHESESWLTRIKMHDAPIGSKYLVSMYFILSTFTQLGIGDIVPRNDGERLFVMLCIIVGLVWGATVISDVTAVMTEMDRSNHEEKERKKQLQTFFVRAKLPRSLKLRIFNYLDHSDDVENQRMSSFNQQQILNALSPGLRQEVVLYTNAALLSRLPSLARQPPEVQAYVVERLRRRIALPGEFLEVENTSADSMFFLLKGKVKLTCGGTEICMYGPGSYFGDIDVLFTPLRVASVQAITTCEVYVLPRDSLYQACLEFPMFGISLRRVALKRLRRYGEALPEPLLDEYFLQMIEHELAEMQRDVQSAVSKMMGGQGGLTMAQKSISQSMTPFGFPGLASADGSPVVLPGMNVMNPMQMAPIGGMAASMYGMGGATASIHETLMSSCFLVPRSPVAIVPWALDAAEQHPAQTADVTATHGSSSSEDPKHLQDRTMFDSSTRREGDTRNEPVKLMEPALDSEQARASGRPTIAIRSRDNGALEAHAGHHTADGHTSHHPLSITARTMTSGRALQFGTSSRYIRTQTNSAAASHALSPTAVPIQASTGPMSPSAAGMMMAALSPRNTGRPLSPHSMMMGQSPLARSRMQSMTPGPPPSSAAVSAAGGSARSRSDSESPTSSGADGFSNLPTESEAFKRVMELRERTHTARMLWKMEGGDEEAAAHNRASSSSKLTSSSSERPGTGSRLGRLGLGLGRIAVQPAVDPPPASDDTEAGRDESLRAAAAPEAYRSSASRSHSDTPAGADQPSDSGGGPAAGQATSKGRVSNLVSPLGLRGLASPFGKSQKNPSGVKGSLRSASKDPAATASDAAKNR